MSIIKEKLVTHYKYIIIALIALASSFYFHPLVQGRILEFFLTDLRFLTRSLDIPFGIFLILALLVPIVSLCVSVFLFRHCSKNFLRYIGFFVASYTTGFILTAAVYLIQAFPYLEAWGPDPYVVLKEFTDSRLIHTLKDGDEGGLTFSKYYLSINNNSYEGFCSYTTDMWLGYGEVLKKVYYVYDSEPVCYDDMSGWAAEAKLIRNGMSWCVDSTGYSGEVIDGTLISGDTSCR